MTRITIAAVSVALLVLGAAAGVSAPPSRASSCAWPGGHDSAGITAPSTAWYFAEGCTRAGFDCWLCVMNPQEEAAGLDISFLTPQGGEFSLRAPVPPLSRYTLNVADVVGEGQDVSMVVASDLPVVAERPMYFAYHTSSSPALYLLAKVEGLPLVSPVSYQETVGILFHEAARYDIHGELAHARAMLPNGGCVQDGNPGARFPGWTPARWGDPYYWIQDSRGRGAGPEGGCGRDRAGQGARPLPLFPQRHRQVLHHGRGRPRPHPSQPHALSAPQTPHSITQLSAHPRSFSSPIFPITQGQRP